MIRINDTISYIPGSREPLSADVAVIRGTEFTWLFDIGCGDRVLSEIEGIGGSKNIVISHFHPDHMGNLPRVAFDACYLGKNTYRYANCGTVVEKDLYAEDGVRLHIFPLPSSHAKGSLGLEVDETFAFVGDALGSTEKKGERVYNAQLLLEEIRLLKSLKAETILQSHRMGSPFPKREVLDGLRAIYAKRRENEAYIEFSDEPF